MPYVEALIAPLVRTFAPRRIVEVRAGPEDEVTEALRGLAARESAGFVSDEPGAEGDLIILRVTPNWRAVRDALEAVRARANEAGASFPLVVAWNAGWPYGRRDRYPDGDPGPPTPRWLVHGGLRPGQRAPTLGRGLYAGFTHAGEEYGIKNGVRTAIEDFISDAREGHGHIVAPWRGGAALVYQPRHHDIEKVRAAFAALNDHEAFQHWDEAADAAYFHALADAEDAARTYPPAPERPAPKRARVLRELFADRGAEAWRALKPALLLAPETNRLKRPRLVRAAAAVAASPIFDAEWYKRRYRDVARGKLSPARHYVAYGADEGRDPGPFFSTAHYQKHYPEHVRARENPLLDYLTCGAELGRNPSPDFDSRFYLMTNRDVAFLKLNPLEHYILYGRAEHRAPKPSGRIVHAQSVTAEGFAAMRADHAAANCIE